MRNEKIFWTLAGASILAFWFGWFAVWASFLGKFGHGWLYTTLIFFVSSLLYYLLIFIATETRKLIAITATITLPSIILGGTYWYNMAIIWIVVNLFYLFAIKRIKKEQQSRVEINVYLTLRRGIPIISTALSLLIASGFYFSIINKQKVGQLPKFDVEISQKVTKNLLGLANIIVPADEIGLILEGATVDEYIRSTMEAQGSPGKFEDREGIGLGDEQSKKAVEEVLLAQLSQAQQQEFVALNRAALGEQLGVELSGNEQMIELINNTLNARVNDVLNGKMFSASVIPLGAALAMLLTVRSLTFVFNAFLYWIVAGVFKIIVWMKLVNVKKETIEVERI